jgi:hypothetical protein
VDQDLSYLLRAKAPQLIEAYAAAGWRCFPVWPGKKNPMYDGWQNGATADLDLLKTYFRPEWDRNVGVVCGERFDAWDIEAPHLPMFYAWARSTGVHLPVTPVAITGRGGIHILTEPTGVGGTRYLYLEGQHIGELKSTGGFILVSPSVTEGRYVWLRAPDGLSPRPAPPWLLSLVKKPTVVPYRPPWPQVSLAPESDIVPLLRAVRETGEGDRNANLHWAANRACDDGIPYEFALARLIEAYMETRLPSEDPREYRQAGEATVTSAYHRG